MDNPKRPLPPGVTPVTKSSKLYIPDYQNAVGLTELREREQQALREQAERDGLTPYLPDKPVLHRADLVGAEMQKNIAEQIALERAMLQQTSQPQPVQQRPLTAVERLHADIEKNSAALHEQTALPDDAEEEETLFEVQSVGQWMELAATQAPPKPLFDEFWYERDLCILFADTNLGKSILAVQIADSISRGVPIGPFRMEAEAQPVLYFDFELTAKQFQARYTHDYDEPFGFSDHFYRAELNVGDSYRERGYSKFEDYLYYQIAAYIRRMQIKVVIIDNLTALCSDNERAKDAYPIMETLNRIKKELHVSMLVIAHTPKRDTTRPIEENHLQGSKQFSNLTDSMFAIGKSHRDPRILYLKQVKHRVGEKVYETDNVCLCQITKPHNFLGFEFMGFARETDHLRQMKDKELGDKVTAVKDLHEAGMSLREIAAQLTIPHTSVARYLKRAEDTDKAA
ncbi:MAG: AAA family ATPase [Bacteroidetes bacterium]|nr:AAA family ATPase [Bacteroidota bacterium]